MMIKLRKLEPSDLPFLYQWENDASSWSDADTHNPLSQQDLRDYIASTTGDIYRDGQLRLIIEEQTTNEKSQVETTTVGCIDLFDFDPRNRRAAIGMYIAPQERGKGVGKLAVEALEKYAFGHLNLRLLYAVISEKNAACTALYRSLGYLPTAQMPGWTLEGPATIWLKNYT